VGNSREDSTRRAIAAAPAAGKMRRSRRKRAAVAGLFLGALAVPALAWAEWTTPVDLSPAGQQAFLGDVAVDTDGDAVFTWTGGPVVKARAESSGGTLSATQNLSGTGGIDSHVAVDADGDAVFVWERDISGVRRIQARARSAAGTLSPVQTLSDAGHDAHEGGVAVDADGDAVFTWKLEDGVDTRIQTMARSAAGTLSAVQDLSPLGVAIPFHPQVAVDADGDAVYTWEQSDGNDIRARARARSAAGTLSAAVQNLSGAGQDATNPKVDIDADGDAVFTWARSDGTKSRIQSRARSAAGTLSTVQDLSAAGQDAFGGQVALDPGGNAVFAWQRFDGVNTRVQARSRSAAGTLSPVQNISNPGQSAAVGEVGVDSDGDAVFTWRRNYGLDSLIEARSRSAAGVLRPFTVLSDPGYDSGTDPGGPQIAVDSTGHAQVMWGRADTEGGGLPDLMQASAGP
jgi:hypothetical protein